MEGLDLDEVGRIADQRHQPLFELRGRRTREGEHQQLFMLDIFKQEQRCQFVDQYTGLATAGSSRNHDAEGFLVGDDLHLSRRERPEELFVFLGRQVALDLVDALAAEVFRNEAPVVHLEIVLYEL